MRVLIFALIVATLCTSVFTGIAFIQVGHAVSEGEDAHNAICALKHDLRVRVATSEAYLRNNKDGVFAELRVEIEQSIANQKRTIKALESAISCEGPEDVRDET